MRLSIVVLLMLFLPAQVLASPSPSSSVQALRQQLRQARQDSTRLRLCVAIGEDYLTGHQFDSLYRYIQLGFDLLRKAPSDYYAGDVYHFLARYYRQRGQYRRGVLPMQQAIYHAQQAHSVRKTVLFHYALAMIYSDAGDLSSAVDQIGLNLKYLRDNNDNDMRGANYLLLIELFKTLNNESMQALYTSRYLALVTPSWPPDHQMFACVLKAESLEKKGRFREAGDLYQRAERFARLTNNPIYVIETLYEQGINFRSQRQNRMAVALFNQVFTQARLVKALATMAGAKRELAMTYLATQRPREALLQARYALALARQNKQVDRILASLQSLVTILEANGRYQEALLVYREEQHLKEQHFNEKNMQKIAYMQAEFETQTKEKTIKLLQKTAQINQLKAIRQQQQLTLAQRTQLAGVSIIGLLVMLMSVVYFFLRKSERNYVVLTRQQQLLQRTASELAETNAVKDKLFTLIGHDLRSPISSVKTNIRQIREADKHPTLLLPLMNHLEKQVDNVLTLLTNLLDWSMIQLKGFQLFLQPILLHEIMEETISQVSEQIEQKQLVIINQVGKTHTAMADKHQLRAVVRNVLGNAIKFTLPGGYIRIRSVEQEEYIELQVRDSGIGMSADQISTLFSTPDVRTGTAGESGIGLGLRMSREMLERQGGILQVESNAARGTLVRIQLPAFLLEEQPAMNRS